ncbi:MAG: c-type cytochrome [Fuerstiella sp.]
MFICRLFPYPLTSRCSFVAACVLLLACVSPARGQSEEDDFPPGLLATYTVGTHTVQRIDRVVSFDWSAAAPDQRLPQGAFSAEWSGNLLARLPGTHTFHAFLAGDASIEIDGQVVLRTSEEWGFATSQPITLAAGDHSIRIIYSSPAESDKPRARLAVFWSSDQFTLEPLPADVLFRDEGSPELAAAAHGRQLVDSLRCTTCHQSDNGLPPMTAPSLERVKGSQSRNTLLQRLWRPQNVVRNSHMPGFDLSPDEAESVAEFLLSVSKDALSESTLKFKDGDQAAGSKLLTSLGCAACHHLPGTEQVQPLATPYEGPELVNVGARRSAAWLDRWLRDPASLNPDHRMPVFELSKDERRQLVAVLAASGSESPDWIAAAEKPDAQRIEEGKQLVRQANCAACHRIPGIKPTAIAPLTGRSFDHNRGDCLNPVDIPNIRSNGSVRVPSYYTALDHRGSVAAWFESQQTLSRLGMADRGLLLLERNGCTACHDRDQSQGLSSIAHTLQNLHPDLKGQSQGLIPPPLTAVGDKLNEEYLKKAVAGEQGERRLPWLLVRMPKFRHSDADRAALVHHLITTDRIPQEADSARQDILAHVDLSGRSAATAADLLLGNRLTGAGGFNCVACHKAGAFEPRNVALGTRGSDIMTMGSRIRPRFFQRWMKNPIRVVAGIEMPAIKKPMPDVLDGSLPAQIGAIWKALSDKRFTPPTVTSRFEQVVNVAPGDPPVILRDVFTIGTDRNRIAVPRAMAIGFGNGHNLLIDLDTMQLRLWTLGEFARQRTEGKSWYWDMPGTVVQQPPPTSAPMTLQTADTRLDPVEDEGRLVELLSYRDLPDGVELDCRVWFDAAGTQTTESLSAEPHFTQTAWADSARPLQAVRVRHRFQADDSEHRAGWTHTVEVLDASPETAVVVAADNLTNAAANGASIHRSFQGSWQKGAQIPLTRGEQATVAQAIDINVPPTPPVPPKPVIVAAPDHITSTPGFTGTRLPLDASIMPTAITWLPDGRMAFTSLKGHVWIAEDTDGDGLPDRTSLFEEGLAAPFGILAETDGLLVSHKPEILRLQDTDGDGRADTREVVASGWGYNDNYHDWTSGLIRDDEQNLYVGLGSDYSQKTRPVNQDRWRGGVIKIDPSGLITPLAMSMRYPMGLAMDKHGHLFATDNQGVQNTFNEINHILPGRHYGVPSAHQPTAEIEHEPASLMVPHPWTRSVNSILFLPEDFPVAELRGHGIGCEYDSRFLIRFTVQDVNGTLQGASYRFSLPDQEAGGSNFIGPICSAISPDGAIFIGSIWDSGWQGGQNTGGIARLIPSGDGLPNGIRELTATPTGFEVEFFRPVDPSHAADAASWSIQAYTREWGGAYATPDSGRHTLSPEQVTVLDGGRRIRLTVKELKPGYVYDVGTTGRLAESDKLWPSEAHYSMKVVPE